MKIQRKKYTEEFHILNSEKIQSKVYEEFVLALSSRRRE